MTDNDVADDNSPRRDTRFKPGVSGNPRGRPKKLTGPGAELKRLLNTRITVRENGVPRKITREEAIYQRMIIDAVNGDTKTGLQIFNLLMKVTSKEKPQEQPVAVTEKDKAIIEDFMQRNAEAYLRRNEEDQKGE
jgi:replication-associated recombination protein RarA